MDNKVYGMTDVIHEIKRVADALEEIIRLVKEDQEKFTARESRERLQKND